MPRQVAAFTRCCYTGISSCVRTYTCTESMWNLRVSPHVQTHAVMCAHLVVLVQVHVLEGVLHGGRLLRPVVGVQAGHVEQQPLRARRIGNDAIYRSQGAPAPATISILGQR